MLVFWLYAFGAFLVRALPHRFSRLVALRLADLRFITDARNRRAVVSNLRQVLGPRPSEEHIERLARRVFRNFACLLLDFLRMSEPAGLPGGVRVEGWRHLEEARSRGRGVVLLGAHLGSWELGGAVLSRLGVPVLAVARDHAHPLVTRFFNRRREASGMRVVGHRGTAREALRFLRRNGVVAMLGDRDFTRGGLAVRFFGRPARLPRSPVTLALRTGAAILPAVAVRRGGGPLRVVFLRPILLRGPAAPDVLEDGLRRCAAALESPIRRYADQWFAFEPLWEPATAGAAGSS